jgi:hypothetical protein
MICVHYPVINVAYLKKREILLSVNSMHDVLSSGLKSTGFCYLLIDEEIELILLIP